MTGRARRALMAIVLARETWTPLSDFHQTRGRMPDRLEAWG